jgi:hypothetical protein
MEKLELTMPQELNDLESRILAKAVYHSSYVHQRAIAYCLGLSFIALGGGIIGLNFSVDVTCLLAFAAIVAGATLQVAVFAYMMIPCQCGKRPVLTAQCRRHLIKQQSKLHVVVLLLGCLAIGFAWNFSIFGLMGSVGLSLGANAMIAIAMQCFQTTGLFVLSLGLVTFVSAVLNKTEWLQTNKVIPESEVQKVARLTEETPDELHSLIDFHLKAGNISTAERLSHKLLTVVESHHHG